MKCGPDECPIVAFSDLTPSEQRVERKRIATKMSEQGFTQEQIAKQLGVSQNTVSLDLRDLSTIDKSKPVKSAANPKGAGRPKGRKTKPRQTEPVKDKILALADQGLSSSEIAANLGVSARAARHEIERERVRREGKADPEIKPEDLALSAQQKLAAAIRQHQRKLDIEFEGRCRDECRRWLNEVSLPQYLKEITAIERTIRDRAGVMDRLTYRKILACLHPDRVQDPALKKRYEEAFRLFTELEKRVLNEKESPTSFRPMPRSYEDLMRMKAKVQAERRAKRTSKPNMSVR